MGKPLTKTDVKKQQSYLTEHPWFSEPYEAAIHLSEEISDLILKPNFSREYPASARDFTEECPSQWNCYIPHTYFDFMSLIGGFDCGSVHLYTAEFKTYSILKPTSSPSNEGKQTAMNKDMMEDGLLQILLGECDHGLYFFNTEKDAYYLDGYDRTTTFVNCIAMLLHAIYRARTNMGLV